MADPFVAMNSIQAANRNESLPLFVEYGYDFDKQCFRYDEKGQNLMVTENEALKVWIYKAILTERYRYLAYDDSYGITIEPYQGRTSNSRYTADQICRNIREGLMVNPRTLPALTMSRWRSGNGMIWSLRLTSLLFTVTNH